MVNAPLFGMLSALGALAQETPTVPADDTGRTVTLVIGTLLGLAVLLAVLTIWYWRRTDPGRASRSAPEPIPVTAAARPAANRSVSARPVTGSGARSPGSEGTAADRGISAEEWLRLTGGRQSAARDRT